MRRRVEVDHQKLEAWRMTFSSGHDFFSDLPAVGVVHPHDIWPPEQQPAARRAFMKAAKVAWRELGAAFMETWRPEPDDPVPWALEKFGPP